MSTSDAPRFSVVTPAYNTGPFVAATIRSVLAQTCGDFELIVVDDGSTDDTAAQVLSFAADPRIRLIRRANGGPSAARNTALAVARGRYVSMLDSDDLLAPHYLETMGGALDDRPEAGLAFTDAWVLDDRTRRVRRATMMHYQRPPAVVPADAASFLRLLLDRNFVYTAVTLRREVLEEVGGFDERLRTAEDWEFWLRIAAAGWPAVRPDGILAVHRVHEEALSADLSRMIEGVCEMYRIVEEEWGATAEVREFARERRARWERRLSRRRDPSLRATPPERVADLARAVRRAAAGRRLWLSEVPSEAAETLASAGEKLRGG